VNIDYSNILPGDDAPEPDEPDVPGKVAPLPPAQSTVRSTNSGATGTHAALTSATGTHQALPRTSGANVVVLSADPALIDLLRRGGRRPPPRLARRRRHPRGRPRGGLGQCRPPD
jgi:hypothetical protein